MCLFVPLKWGFWVILSYWSSNRQSEVWLSSNILFRIVLFVLLNRLGESLTVETVEEGQGLARWGEVRWEKLRWCQLSLGIIRWCQIRLDKREERKGSNTSFLLFHYNRHICYKSQPNILFSCYPPDFSYFLTYDRCYFQAYYPIFEVRTYFLICATLRVLND